MFEEFPELGLDKAKCSAIWKVILESKYFWANLDPFNPSIMFTIDRIKNKVFITNRPGIETKQQTIWFLERCGITSPEVIVAEHKGPVIVERNVTAIIDDYWKNVVDSAVASPSTYTAFLYAPYNKIHHAEWKEKYDGEIVLSVDHFISECVKRNLIVWNNDPTQTPFMQ
jgi:hypothetical protein